MRVHFGGSARLCAAVAAFSGASLIAMTAAQAGGFAVREQSAYYQGMSFAGAGTGDTLSSMYWNSAAAASVEGFNTETHLTVLDADTEMTATDGVLTGGGAGCLVSDLCDSGDIADPALIPASYANYQLSDRLFLGLATNSGFGTVTKPSNTDWAGAPLAVTSDIFSINFNPTVAYKVSDELTVGVGAQIEYFDVRLNNAPGLLPEGRNAELDDIGFGATAGVTWKPAPGTTVGLGYRSAVKLNLEGDYFAGNAVQVAPDVFIDVDGKASAELTLPDMITLGLRQTLTENLDLLAGYEWTNWSRVGSIPVAVEGFGEPETLRLEYDDGHFVSLGLEYAYSPSTLLRTGIAWEKSPIVDEERNVLLPDADRLWLSVGATHHLSDKITIDLGYTHIFVDDASICRGPDTGPCADVNAANNLIVAESESSVDIVSASLKYHWGGAEPELEPLK